MNGMSPFITICEPRPEHSKLSSGSRAIKARQGVELHVGDLRVVDEDGSEVPKDGETLGEIVVLERGHEGLLRSGATAHAFGADGMHTGDARSSPGRICRDPRSTEGHHYQWGENISSVEVEGILPRHPSIQEVAVAGSPHEKWGEAPCAFVVLRSGAAWPEAELGNLRERIWRTSIPQGSVCRGVAKTATGVRFRIVLRGRKSAIIHQ